MSPVFVEVINFEGNPDASTVDDSIQSSKLSLGFLKRSCHILTFGHIHRAEDGIWTVHARNHSRTLLELVFKSSSDLKWLLNRQDNLNTWLVAKSHTVTLAPSLTNLTTRFRIIDYIFATAVHRSAVALPRPLAPPVTRATVFFNISEETQSLTSPPLSTSC